MRGKRRLGISLAAALVLVLPPPGPASVIPSKVEDPTARRAADLTQVRDVLARHDVGSALAACGLGSEEIQERLDRLSNEELRTLARSLDQIQAAGDVPEYIWILLAIFLAVSILVMIF
jgi:hypothetical protein